MTGGSARRRSHFAVLSFGGHGAAVFAVVYLVGLALTWVRAVEAPPTRFGDTSIVAQVLLWCLVGGPILGGIAGAAAGTLAAVLSAWGGTAGRWISVGTSLLLAAAAAVWIARWPSAYKREMAEEAAERAIERAALEERVRAGDLGPLTGGGSGGVAIAACEPLRALLLSGRTIDGGDLDRIEDYLAGQGSVACEREPNVWPALARRRVEQLGFEGMLRHFAGRIGPVHAAFRGPDHRVDLAALGPAERAALRAFCLGIDGPGDRERLLARSLAVETAFPQGVPTDLRALVAPAREWLAGGDVKSVATLVESFADRPEDREVGDSPSRLTELGIVADLARDLVAAAATAGEGVPRRAAEDAMDAFVKRDGSRVLAARGARHYLDLAAPRPDRVWVAPLLAPGAAPVLAALTPGDRAILATAVDAADARTTHRASARRLLSLAGDLDPACPSLAELDTIANHAARAHAAETLLVALVQPGFERCVDPRGRVPVAARQRIARAVGDLRPAERPDPDPVVEAVAAWLRAHGGPGTPE
ncbi:hypothetical protein L6R50_22125 [Myxococcota bacterium]|nr:hypothetical protein [Myxococcota bacterium]